MMKGWRAGDERIKEYIEELRLLSGEGFGSVLVQRLEMLRESKT